MQMKPHIEVFKESNNLQIRKYKMVLQKMDCKELEMKKRT